LRKAGIREQQEAFHGVGGCGGEKRLLKEEKQAKEVERQQKEQVKRKITS
jgi:hypothetical protein